MIRVSRLLAAALSLGVLGALAPAPPAEAAPTTVNVVGSMQSEVGCPSDFDPSCAETTATELAGGLWAVTVDVPSGAFGYKVVVDGVFLPAGANLPLDVPTDRSVVFVYDPVTGYIADSVNGEVAVAVGDFQSELGCPADFAPDCLASLLRDEDGDGIHTYTTSTIPEGDWRAKTAHDLSFDENYGAGGVAGGSEIPFSVPAAGTPVTFSYDPVTHVLTITVGVPGTGSPGAGSDPTGGAVPAPELPDTGVTAQPLVLVAAMLLISGVAAAAFSRRTRRSA